MELFELILILLACVIVSSVLDQAISRVSLPLIQIAIGFVVALLVPSASDVEVESELFLVLFIAPLLFNEAREANRRQLWSDKGSILSLAIGLVLAGVLVVGFALHLLVPSVPLAAAFACAAALGPTDAAAVGALGSTVRLTKRQGSLLSGEALINDASGVVSFQFAIAAAVTGAFSAVQAVETFGVLFFGGILAGVAMGFVAIAFMRLVRRRGYESTTVHVIYEVFTPFVIFLAAEAIHVSGILAVVAAGLVMAERRTPLASTYDMQHRLVSSSVWSIIVFLINGVVFVLLGMQLPNALSPSVTAAGFTPGILVAYVLVLTALSVAVRFVWVAAMELLHKDPQTGKRGCAHVGTTLREALVTTIAGPKGAVTLSIILTIPYVLQDGSPFPNRSLIIFLTAGVILCTLLLADFALPLLAPKPKAEADDMGARVVEADAKVTERVIKELRDRMADGSKPEYEPATRLAIARYRMRLGRDRLQHDACGDAMASLSEEVLREQRRVTEQLRAQAATGDAPGEGVPTPGSLGDAALTRVRGSIGYTRASADLGRQAGGARTRVATLARRLRGTSATPEEMDRAYLDACLFAMRLEQVAIDYLTPVAKGDGPRARAAKILAGEHRAALASIKGRLEFTADGGAGATGDGAAAGVPQGPHAHEQFAHARMYADEVNAGALSIELDVIRRMTESGEIDRDVAHRLREDVYLRQMSLEG